MKKEIQKLIEQTEDTAVLEVIRSLLITPIDTELLDIISKILHYS